MLHYPICAKNYPNTVVYIFVKHSRLKPHKNQWLRLLVTVYTKYVRICFVSILSFRVILARARDIVTLVTEKN